MTHDELKEVLQLHKMWLRDEEGGVKANLSEADLSKANLYGANLSGANLSGADLSEANLYGADGLAVTSAGPLGRDNRITYYKYLIDEVNCGRFHGTLDEFAAKVEETHKNNPVYLAEYRAAIAFFRAVREVKLKG